MAVNIPQNPIKYADYAAIHSYFIKSTDYSAIDSIETAPALLEAKKLAPSLSLRQILSLRSAIMKNKIIKRFGYLTNKAKKAAEGYEQGKSIIELANAFDFSPLHLLKAILKYQDKPTTEDLLTGRDLEQKNLAYKNDLASSDNERQTLQRAIEAEEKFVAFIKSLGLEFKTQAELSAEQTRTEGHATLTPDLLFNQPTEINGQMLNWLEFKNYVGAPIGFISKSNAKQARKYHDAYGPGAIVYSCSFVDSYTIPGASLLDISYIFEK